MFCFFILTILFFHALFKIKQREGGGRLNDAYTSIGGGSFVEGIKQSLGGLFWFVMCGVYLIIGIFLFICYDANNRSNNSLSDEPTKVEVLNKEIISKSNNPTNPTPKQDSITTNNSTPNPPNTTEPQYDGDDPIIRSRLGLPPKN